MNRNYRFAATAAALLLGISASGAAYAQKQGGILKMDHRDSPASASIHEEATYSVNIPFMGVFNNLVMYKQDVAQNSLDTIVPDLASSWSWNADHTKLTFKLRSGVKWHDGKPFTSKDVKCTFDLLQGKGTAKFRKNPRQAWYENLKEVTTNGDFEATFVLQRAQPSLLALSSGAPFAAAVESASELRASTRTTNTSTLFTESVANGASVSCIAIVPFPAGVVAVLAVLPQAAKRTVAASSPAIPVDRTYADGFVVRLRRPRRAAGFRSLGDALCIVMRPSLRWMKLASCACDRGRPIRRCGRCRMSSGAAPTRTSLEVTNPCGARASRAIPPGRPTQALDFTA